MGLLHMTNAISFMNNDCKLVREAACSGGWHVCRRHPY